MWPCLKGDPIRITVFSAPAAAGAVVPGVVAQPASASASAAAEAVKVRRAVIMMSSSLQASASPRRYFLISATSFAYRASSAAISFPNSAGPT
jgi:hypothetical protein